MKKKAARKPAKALTPVPSKVRRRGTGFGSAETVAFANESELLSDLRSLIQSARQRITSEAFATQSLLCWHLGRRLLSENLHGSRAAYAKQILVTVSRELSAEYWPSFSYPAFTRVIRFAEWMTGERILATLSQEFSWSDFVELLPIKEPLASEFYRTRTDDAEGCLSSLGVLPYLSRHERHTGDGIQA